VGETEARPGRPAVRVLKGTDYRRELGPASDTWQHEGFRFSLYSPWQRTADPAKISVAAARDAFLPAVFGELGFDNRESAEPVEIIWGMHDPAQLARPLADTDPMLSGFAFGTNGGFATTKSSGAELRQAFDVLAPQYFDHRGLHLLGPECALVWRVPARTTRRFPLVLGFHHAGWITTGLRCRYLYTRYFERLEEVLRHGLKRHRARLAVARQRDREVAKRGLSAERHWLLSQAVHSYFGSTQLLLDRGAPLWAVNEGEYRMLNTFDLAVDQLFFELEWHPWAVRRVLELFVRGFAYVDQVRDPAGKWRPGGIAFTHDMGVGNHFTPRGRSSYECRDLTGCFSQMSMEELINWVCCAVTYGLQQGDTAWLQRMHPVLRRCAKSLERRDAIDPAARDGLLKLDSSRCGPGGSEITTYDSLDIALGQARNNLYLGVKTQAAWWLLAAAFGFLKDQVGQVRALAAADRLAVTLMTKFDSRLGAFPAVFEGGNQSRILPAVEGLVFPWFLGSDRAWIARYRALFDGLCRHMRHALQPGVCLDAQSGAWKISSTSHNTWLSKVYLAQVVVEQLMPDALTAKARAADAVHLRFSRDGAAAAFAAVDQLDSATGRDLGSRYYPRLVTNWLWLGRKRRKSSARSRSQD
jgi:hypothetical protein